MVFIRGLAKSNPWPGQMQMVETQIGGGGRACRSGPRTASIREAVNQTSSRGKRARTKPIGIALSFAVSRPLLRSVWYAFSDATPIARVSSGPNTKSRTREETVPIGLLSLSGGSAIGLSATGAWAVAGGDIMMSVPVQDPAFAEARIAIAARIVTPRESGRDVSVWS